MDRLYAIANKHKLRVVEDAAQALGSTLERQARSARSATSSRSASRPTRTSPRGEGGCLVLNNLEEARLAEKYRLQGVTRSGVDGIDVDVLGGKYNMSDVAGRHRPGPDEAPGRGDRPSRGSWRAHYFDCFGPDFEAQTGAQLPVQAFGTSNWHLFQIILPDHGPGTRADFMTRLQKEHNVGTGYHYAPIHLFTMYRARGFKEGMFPVSEKIGRLTVTLPMFNAMTIADVERARSPP